LLSSFIPVLFPRHEQIPRAAETRIEIHHPEGKKRLSDEFEFLWRTKRPEVTAALAAAAAEATGPRTRSYIYRKKQLREIERPDPSPEEPAGAHRCRGQQAVERGAGLLRRVGKARG